MREDLDKKLVETFPNLYAERYKPMSATAMCWGFQHSDGWFQLIWDLSEKLEALIVAIPEDKRGSYTASTVKEKFGTLRFYMNAETEEMSKAISDAEDKSCVTCENCGKAGTERTNRGWMSTLCDDCQKIENDRVAGLGKTPEAPYTPKEV